MPEKEKQVAHEPDTATVKAAIKGDIDSFTQLARHYYPAMVAIAHSVLGDRHLAEDAAQEAFAKAAVRLPQLRRKRKFAGWLAAICRNESKDMLRRTNNQSVIIENSVAVTQSNPGEASEVVREAIGRLSAAARELIFMRYYDGLSYEQISAVLGISEQAINGRLRRAKKKMANYLRRQGFSEVGP